MNKTGTPEVAASSFSRSPAVFWVILLAIPGIGIWWWTDYRWRIASGEPPLVPYQIPWLGHGLDFMKDINGFAQWVRSVHPTSDAATVQLAGQHLYLIFDAKLASQIYRRSQTFIFDPFILQTSAILGANKKDMEILAAGAQLLEPAPLEETAMPLIHELHKLTPQHLTGEPLDKLTEMFIDTICSDIDKRFSPDQESSYEWETIDICVFVKSTWCHASISALFGSHMYEIWPGIEAWLWEFDKHFQTMFTGMPRFIIPKPYALLDEGQKMSAKWEADAMEASERDPDPDRYWDKHWGVRFVKLRNELLRNKGLSTKFRAGNHVAFLWGLNANAIPIAMQTIVQAALSPKLLATLVAEINSCTTSPNTFDLKRVTASPVFKSVYLESLRYSTASPSPRVVRQDCQVGEYHLRRGNMAIVHSRTLQSDEETWCIPGKPESHPSKFWAERFLDGDARSEEARVEENAEAETNWEDAIKKKWGDHPMAKAVKRKNMEPVSGPKDKAIQTRMLSLRPFGGGTTLCPGRHFATNEIMGGLAALLLRLEIEVDSEALAKNGEPIPDMSKQGGLFPDRGLMCRVRRRRGV
ncbi:putative cholesterol 7-alpha-monooxygenase [Amylocarpus encephaloides]|uniref:Cholesterol 7-alpha-monooxygenase n=1 Tax=Amylocarpus encephaloides TaxID=45428 RepID=A0A9P8C9J5_9HELO|nr:putative cholesterol 7-alpha-monooxygenase [Amylocarpus encephaloides]